MDSKNAKDLLAAMSRGIDAFCGMGGVLLEAPRDYLSQPDRAMIRRAMEELTRLYGAGSEGRESWECRRATLAFLTSALAKMHAIAVAHLEATRLEQELADLTLDFLCQ